MLDTTAATRPRSGPSGPPTRTIVALASPIAMNAILLQSITIIDTLLVAPLGEHALAAMGLATGLFGMVIGTLYGNLDPATIDSLHSLTPLLLALPWMRTSNTICGNVLRAGGLAGWSFKVHAGTQWLFTVPVTLLFVLVLDLSVAWVFAVIVMDEFVKAIPFHRGMKSGRWKQRLVQA